MGVCYLVLRACAVLRCAGTEREGVLFELSLVELSGSTLECSGLTLRSGVCCAQPV